MIVVKVIIWIVLIAAGALVAGTIANAVSDRYHERRRQQRELEARAALLRARRERAERDREVVAAMEYQFSSEGGTQ